MSPLGIFVISCLVIGSRAETNTFTEPREVEYTTTPKPREGEYTTTHKPREGEYTTTHKPREVEYTTTHKPREGKYTTTHKPREGEYTTTHKPREGEYTTTHKPREGEYTTTHKPREGEYISYRYSYPSQHLVIRVHDTKSVECYLVTLSDHDKGQIHTNAGMRAVELKALGKLSSGMSVTKNTLDAADVKWCNTHNGHTHYSYFTLNSGA